MVRDVTERNLAELRIKYLNRVYAVVSDTNQVIVREKDPRAMLMAACRIAVEKGLFRLAWIGLADTPGGKTERIKVAAHAGATAGTLEIIEMLLGGEVRDCACSFTMHALRTGTHGVCNDIEHDLNTVEWREAALQRGYRAVASLPLKSNDKVIGTFNLYAGETGFFDDVELRLLDELALDIEFALEVSRRDQDHKRAEAELHASEERFRQLAENINEVFWIVNPADGQMIYVSPAYEKIWGRPCDSLYRSPSLWLDAVHADDRAQVLAAKIKQARGDYDETYRILRPDGSVRWIRDRAFPLRNAIGEVFRVVGTASDITANRNLEEQFRQAQKMEAFGMLAGGVAHDFNNMLGVIIGYSDIWLLKLPPDSPVCQALITIRSAGERAAALTRQLLAFSRKSVLAPKVLDINIVVRDTEKMLVRLIGEDIQLTSILDPHIPRIKVDPAQLGQVLINLAVNSRDAMPLGGSLIIQTGTADFDDAYARSHPGAQPGQQAMLSVSDTGSGMTPEVMARIFEPFFTTKGVGKGTGLGLAVVHGVVTQSGGTIEVESIAGRGTTFSLYFPATLDAIQPVRILEEPLSHAGVETVLLVEDESNLCDLTAETLRSYGYIVLAARTGPEALAKISNHTRSIDLLITDVVMPGMSGRELADILLRQVPGLKVLFMSGYTDDAMVRHGINIERVAFLQKPFGSQELLRKVREVVTKR